LGLDLKRFAIAYTVGADLRVCPGLGMRTATGADTQVCPYTDRHTAIIGGTQCIEENL